MLVPLPEFNWQLWEACKDCSVLIWLRVKLLLWIWKLEVENVIAELLQLLVLRRSWLALRLLASR